jgi:hypothetical protein
MRIGSPYDPRPTPLSTEANPTPVPAPERIAHDKRSRADFFFAQMLLEAASAGRVVR